MITQTKSINPENLSNPKQVQHLVFIDSNVPDYSYLAAGVIPGAEVIILEPNRDGIKQITEALNSFSFSYPVSLHIVSHGSPGCLYLGNTQLNLTTLDRYASELKTWFSYSPLLLGEGQGERLLLYGCNVAAGDTGEEFITKLNKITGAEIAASTTRVGNAAKGGNWELDYQTSKFTPQLAFSLEAQNIYTEVLATVTYNDDPADISIPDNNTTGISRTFTVTDDLTITDVNFGLDINHTYRADLDITLRHPDGTTIQLTTDNGSSADNLYVTFDDSASTNITADSSTHNTSGYTNQRKPEQALSAFNGKSSLGTWTLTIKDDEGSDTGAYEDSQLVIEGTPVGDIFGTVYNDYDNDGIQELSNDASEVGVEGITVTAYDAAGAVVATDTTDANGDYSLTTGSVDVRVEFTNLPDNFVASSPNATGNTVSEVAFISGTSNEVNFGIHRPSDVTTGSLTDIDLITACYVFGAGTSSDAAIILHNYNDEGSPTSNPTAQSHTILATYDEVGAVGGIAYHRESNSTFAGAFYKRHSGLGPGGTGAIYLIDNATQAVSTFATIPNAGADDHDTNNYELDAASFAIVGKRGLGDVELSEDGTTLWTVNLNDKKLYKLPVGATSDPLNPTPPASGDIVGYDIIGDIIANGDNLGTNASTDVRPFALSVKDGLVYIGMVNTAETSQLTSDLHAYVYTFDPNNPTAAPVRVLDFALDYDRDHVGGLGANQVSANWNPWTSTFPTGLTTINTNTTNGEEVSYTQPILSDIDFDPDGNMILGFRDRWGDQLGDQTPDPDGNGNYRADTGGDLLRATFDGTDWTIEPHVTTPSSPDLEHFDNEFLEEGAASDNDEFHAETAQGSTTIVPGVDEVVTIALDPTRAYSGGFEFFNTSDGSFAGHDVTETPLFGGAGTITAHGLEIFSTPTTGGGDFFGKANGLGDIEFAAEAAPIEIGNRIWNDTDADGIQDAGETGRSGMTVSLYDVSGASEILVGTVDTDSNGEYYFNDGNVTLNGATGIDPFTDYEIRLTDTADFLSLNLSATNQGNNDEIDSDATIVNTFPTIALTTGASGENNYSYDIGFHTQDVDYGDAPDTTTGNGAGDYTTTAANGGASHVITSGLSLGAEIDGDDGTLQNTSADADDTNGTPNDEDGISTFDPLVEDATSYSVEVDVTNTPGNAANLVGWIDFDGDGQFESSEASDIISNITASGTETLTWSNLDTLPDGITVGTTYARFRLSTDALDANSSTGAATDGEVEDYQLSIKNSVNGTGGSDSLTGSTGDDIFIGGAGRDTLAGNGGDDCFYFNRTSDGIDLIEDFDTNGDKIDFSSLFATGGELAGATISNDPIVDGYVEVIDVGSYTLIQVDFNPSDDASFDPTIHPYNKNVVLLENVDHTTINASDFIF